MPGTQPSQAIQALKAHLATVADLRATAAVLRWDQETYMPARGAAGRAEQSGTLTRLSHDLFISSWTRDLLVAAEAVLDRLDPDSDEAALVRMTRRDYDRQSRLPAEFVAARARAASLSTQVWREVRPRHDLPPFPPPLAARVGFSRRGAYLIWLLKHPHYAALGHFEAGETSKS